MNIDRIKSNVIIDEKGCWLWKNSCNSAGYGQLTENGKYWTSHRYTYACTDPNLKENDVVRHRCHNKKCCNPEHLIKGTHKDNYNDSRDVHLTTAKLRRKKWVINGVSYGTVREASKHTGLHQQTICKYTENGIFNINEYRKGCIAANAECKF